LRQALIAAGTQDYRFFGRKPRCYGSFARRRCGWGSGSRVGHLIFASVASHHRSKLGHWSTASQYFIHAMPTLALAQFDLGRSHQAA
jgi:hypothetical protein